MKKNILFVGISVILLILLGIGLSYSMWNMSTSQETSNVIATTNECFDIKLTNQNNNINLENAYPISNEKGKALTPFTFTIKNTCDMFLSYTVSLESLKGSTLASRFINVMVNNEAVERLSNYETADTVNNGSVESRILAKGSLSKDDSEDYSLRLWIDYDTTMEDLDNETKVLKSKVVIKATPSIWDPVSYGYTTLHDAILANEYQTTPAKALEKIEAKGTPALSKTAPVIKWVEKTGETSIRQVVKPTADAISSVPQLSNLSSNEQYMYVCTTKAFNQENGNYILSNCSLKDPTTLDYSGNTKYYYSTEYMAYNKVSGKFYADKNTSDSTVYQIFEATKKLGTENYNGITYASNVYNLSCITLSEDGLEADNSDKGLYKDTDDYGDTYYYRGSVKNNNVYFAGFYWQIVRINGDGSIRLMYNGIEKEAIGIAQSINNKTYQFNSEYNDPAYVGYMYGNPDATTFAEVHANMNDSTIKIAIDDWYKTNIVDKRYLGYISNSVGFCGNKNLSSDSSGDGIQKDSFSSFKSRQNDLNAQASYSCENPSQNLYTTSNSFIGNKSLKYPIGLITYDELIFAGLSSEKKNKLFWAYSNVEYWTMSPGYFQPRYGIATVFHLDTRGFLSTGLTVSRSFLTRPVINLKPDVEISGGIGTVNEPFIIKTD